MSQRGRDANSTSEHTSAPTRIDPSAAAITVADVVQVPLPRLEEGERIGDRYGVVGLLGRGGFGEVYRVRDEVSGNDLALKLYRVGSQSALALDALKGEFALLGALSHPNLAQVHDFGWMGEDVAYFTQDVVIGQRLDALDLELSSPAMIRLLAQLCRALDYLHTRGILHRDVKPSNVVVDVESEHLTLLDFGISRAFHEIAQGVLVGTHAFMSPEAVRGGPVDARSDLYSLGVTLYRLAAGELPFTGEAGSILSGHLYVDPPPLPREVSPALREVVLRLLGKEPGERYASAAEVMEALARATGVNIALDTDETLASYVLSGGFVGHGELVERIVGEAQKKKRRGAPLLLEGPAGTGKSRILREAQRTLQLGGVDCIGLEVRRGEAARRLAPELAAAVLSPDVLPGLSTEDRLELARAVPSLRLPGERIAIPVDPERARALRIRALGRALALRFRQRAGLVVVEDLHRADEHVITVLCGIVEAAAHVRADCTFVVTSRPGLVADSFRARTGAEALHCADLAPEASLRLVQTMFGEATFVSETAFGRLMAGGPCSALLVQESLRLAVENREIVRSGGTWTVDADVPARSLEAVLTARVKRLGNDARMAALASAIVGAAVPATDLGALVGKPLPVVAPAVAELERAGILEARSDGRGRVVYAMHDRFVDVVPSTFPERRVATAHRRAARWHARVGRRDPHSLARSAEHLHAAGDTEKAVERFERAAEQADGLGRPDLSVRILSRGHTATGTRPSFTSLLWRHDLASKAGLRADAEAALAEMTRRRRRADVGQRVELDLRIAAGEARRGEGGAARRRARRALGRARELGLRDAEGRLLSVLGEVEFMFGDMERAYESQRAAARIARERRAPEDEVRAELGAALAALHVGRLDRAQSAAESAEQASKDARDFGLRSDALRQLGNVVREQGRNRKALGLYRRAVKVARDAGSVEREAKALNNLGTAAQWCGQVGAATDAFRRSIELKLRIGATVSTLLSYNNLGALFLSIGNHDGAEVALRKVAAGSEGGDHMVVGIAVANLADLDAIRGRLDEAIGGYERSYKSCRERGFTTQKSHALSGLARTLLMRRADGDLLEVERIVAQLEHLMGVVDLPEAQRRHWTTRAMWADARGDAVAAHEAARLACRARDRETMFSDVFGTVLEARWIHALTLARLGRTSAAERSLGRARKLLSSLAACLSGVTAQRDFVHNHPMHSAIDAGTFDTPRGWTWRP